MRAQSPFCPQTSEYQDAGASKLPLASDSHRQRHQIRRQFGQIASSPTLPTVVVTSSRSAENRNTHKPSSATRGFVPRRLSYASRRTKVFTEPERPLWSVQRQQADVHSFVQRTELTRRLALRTTPTVCGSRDSAHHLKGIPSISTICPQSGITQPLVRAGAATSGRRILRDWECSTIGTP
jgi:hypothetical protein